MTIKQKYINQIKSNKNTLDLVPDLTTCLNYMELIWSSLRAQTDEIPISLFISIHRGLKSKQWLVLLPGLWYQGNNIEHCSNPGVLIISSGLENEIADQITPIWESLKGRGAWVNTIININSQRIQILQLPLSLTMLWHQSGFMTP